MALLRVHINVSGVYRSCFSLSSFSRCSTFSNLRESIQCCGLILKLFIRFSFILNNAHSYTVHINLLKMRDGASICRITVPYVAPAYKHTHISSSICRFLMSVYRSRAKQSTIEHRKESKIVSVCIEMRQQLLSCLCSTFNCMQ